MAPHCPVAFIEQLHGRRAGLTRFAACLVIAVIAAACGASGTAEAGPVDRPPSAEEQRAFAEGVRLMQTGDAAGAVRAFQSGYDAGHDPAFLVRLGEAQEKAGAPAAAAASYRRYVRQSPGAADAKEIAARAERLAPETQATTGGAPVPGPGAATPAAPDERTPAAETEVPSTNAAPGAAPRPAAVAPKEDEEESLRAFADENPAARSRLDVAAWIGTGVTVALLGVAAFYGAKAGEKASDINRLTSNFDPRTDVPVEYATVADQYNAAMRDGKHADRLAKGFAIAAGATAVASAALFIIDAVRDAGGDSEPRSHASLAPLVTAGGAGLGWGGSF